MIVPDVNLLVYAHVKDMPHHERAHKWWTQVINGEESVGLAWSVITGFIRITSTRELFSQPLSVEQACEVANSWLSNPLICQLHPSADHLSHVQRVATEIKSNGRIIPDVHLAVLAFEHGGTVYSADSDFARFGMSKWINPLV